MTDPAGHVARLRSFAEAYTAAWCSREAARVASFYEEGGSLSVNCDTPAVGREAIAEVARGFMIAFPDLRVFLDELRVDDAGTSYHWTLTGTYAATGRAVRISGREVWRIGEGGLIAESRGHFDEEEYLRQVGQ
jgi:hypothetical protein